MKIKQQIVICLLLGSLLFFACKPDNFDGCPNQPSFNVQVQPIIEMNCATPLCHGFGGFAPFQLLSHHEIDSAAIHTNFLMSLKHQTAFPMPRIDPFLPDAVKLSDSLIQIIECWVNQGRPNN